MPITILSSHDFNQDAARALKTAVEWAVVITDRGVRSSVLLGYDHYLALGGGRSDIVALLSMAEAADIDFETPNARITGTSGDLS